MFATIFFPEGREKQFEMFRYPGGEVQVRLTTRQIEVLKSVTSVHVIARISDGEIVAIAQLLDAIRSVCPSDIKLILPYLPYGRADRRFVDGDCNGLQTFGRILNTFAGVEVVTLDVHSLEAAKYIRHFTNIEPTPIIESVIDQLDGTTTYGTSIITTGILLPDAGAAKRYGYNRMFATKKRDPQTGKLLGFTVPPKEEFQCDNVLIVDDICDGGGTFLGIADQMKDYGFNLYLYVTHGIFSKGYNELLKRFKKIYTTDSFTVNRDIKDMPAQGLNNIVSIPCLGTILNKIVDRPALYENVIDEQVHKAAKDLNWAQPKGVNYERKVD